MNADRRLSLFRKDTWFDGEVSEMECVEINGQTYVIVKGLLRVIMLEDEWYQDVKDPDLVIAALRDSGLKVDLFSFWQRLPEITPKYRYPVERDSIAVLPIKSYSFWYHDQIERKARNKVRKAEKQGISVRPARFDDSFVEGMISIFNETPIRQGRHYLHYGKDFETVKREFSRFLFREEIFGAYLGEELVGFIMLADAGSYIFLGQIISKIAYRNFAPTNALLAKAVERCADKGAPYLVYALWLDDSLGDFKRSNGFERFDLPRYFVPLTRRGMLATKLGVHRGWKAAIPKQIVKPLKKMRRRWYDLYWSTGKELT